MKILTIHADYLKVEPKKKALKEAEIIEEKIREFGECLVVFTAVEKDDEKNQEAVTKRYVHEIIDIAKQVGTKDLVLYPYVHLSNNPSNPETAISVMKNAEKMLSEDYNVARAPFGWYKAFEVRCKGHPLSELSRSFSGEAPIIKEEKKEAKHDEKFKLDLNELSDHQKLNATSAFLLIKALKDLYPSVEPGSFGFHNDQVYIDFSGAKIKNDDLPIIEKKFKELLKKGFLIQESEQAKGRFQEEISKDISIDSQAYALEGITLVPLFKKPFIAISAVKSLKILNISSAYWKNNSSNVQLTRLYAIAFDSEEKMQEFVKQQHDADLRDHKKLGKELEIFMQSDLVGKGLPIWLPKGEIIRREIENFVIETEKKAGYVRVVTPHLAKKELFEMSGHLPYYKDTMYPAMVMDDGTYYLKAMNCPMHHLIFKNKIRSYQDMPMRIAEYGTCYRNEISGTLSGLLRVRMLSMNDAHMYCRQDQIEQEFEGVMNMILMYYKIFGLEDFWFRLSLGDRNHNEKYIDEPENWKISEDILRNVLRKLKVNFIEAPDEAAFYGPKVDIQYKAVSGREETMSTIQLDFAAKKRFNLSYADKDGKDNNEVYVIHRAPLSVHERFIAFLIEHYSGKFPLWLSPIQVKVVTITDRNIPFAREIVSKLQEKGIRAEMDERAETMGKKVRDAQLEKINYIVTIGDKEVEKNTLAVRTRAGEVKFGVDVNEFITSLLDEIKKKIAK